MNPNIITDEAEEFFQSLKMLIENYFKDIDNENDDSYNVSLVIYILRLSILNF